MKEEIVVDSRYGITITVYLKEGVITIHDNRYVNRKISMEQETAFKLAYKLMSAASEL